MLDEENILWLEEPIRHDNYCGSAQLTSELKTPIQIGENFSEAAAMAAALAVKACDYVMPDLERIGGVSGWQRAAALAFVNGIEILKSAPIYWRLRQLVISLNTWIGRTKSCRSRFRLWKVRQWCAIGRETGSFGT